MSRPASRLVPLWVLLAAASFPLAASACPPEDRSPGESKPVPAEPTDEALLEVIMADAGATPTAAPTDQLTLKEEERELRKLKAKYLGGIRNPEIRAIGLAKMREHTDPTIFPVLIEVFRKEKDDARAAVLDHIAAQDAQEADTVLAWTAIFDKDPGLRALAADRIITRTETRGEVPLRTQRVIAAALGKAKGDALVAGAQMAGTLKLYEAIPMLIAAQGPGGGGVGGSGAGAGGGHSDIAYIAVVTQQAFISDLEPVVADSAVGFDPEVSVLNEGTVLRIHDAYVTIYRTEVHDSLVGLANAGWDGRSTADLGYDRKAWENWYATEFKPHREKVERELALKAESAAAKK
ncbi:MAG: hypothetical protein H7Y88_06325 [Phycisphaerales bacterium]|nr:hypothetical protein [Phycisphaerales bacterium]